MCFNQEVSLVVFIFGVAAAAKVIAQGVGNLENKNVFPDCQSRKFGNDYLKKEKFNKTEIVTGIFIFVISLMQLVEYFLWKNMGNNPYSSYSIMFTLAFQVVAYFVANYEFGLLSYGNDNATEEEKALSYTATATMSSMLLFLCVATYMLWNTNGMKLRTMSSTKTCRLLWAPLVDHGFYTNMATIGFRVSYLASLALLSWIDYDWVGYLLFAMTLVPALSYTVVYQGGVTAVYGSIWCFGIVVIGIAAGLFDFLPGNYKEETEKISETDPLLSSEYMVLWITLASIFVGICIYGYKKYA